MVFMLWFVLRLSSRSRNKNVCLENNYLRNGKYWPENTAGKGADIIIVGAGVVGSSLAYALGKVTIFSIKEKKCKLKL